MRMDSLHLFEKSAISRWMRTLLSLVLFACISLVFSCKKEEPKSELPQSYVEDPVSGDYLVIAATGDFHAALDRAEGLASVIRDLRKKYGERFIYLDAGDQFQGSVEGNISKGEAITEFFNLIGLDAAALGNHEFDYGPDVPDRVWVKPGEDGMGTLKKRAKEAKYPLLSANFVLDPPVPCAPKEPGCNALGQKTVFSAHKIMERAGDRVCIIGATTPVTEYITSPTYLTGTKFEDVLPVIQAESRYLREQQSCDWVLLTIHEGFRYKPDGKTLRNVGLMDVMNRMPPGTVDAVVGGHSHVRVQLAIHGVPIIQAGTVARVVGVMVLKKNASGISHRFEPFIPVPDTAVAFDVTSLLGRHRRVALTYKREVIGKTTAPFVLDKQGECALGNLVSDAILYAAKEYDDACCALMNSGGIRSNLPQGKVTQENVFRLMPFNDTLTVVEMKGEELRRLLEIAFSGVLGMPAVSGLRVTLRKRASDGSTDRDLNGDGKMEEWEQNLIVKVTDTKGRPLQDGKTYRLATINFLAEGGDYQNFVYDQIPLSRIRVHGDVLIRDLLISYFKKQSLLIPSDYYSSADPRIILQKTDDDSAASTQ